MSDLVLARVQPLGLRGGIYSAEGPPETHAFRVLGKTLASACGRYSLDADMAEYVEAFTGTPCMACWALAIIASDVPAIGRDGAEYPALPSAEPEPAYALSWQPGRYEVHALPERETTGSLDGDPMTVAACGAIGTPSAEWPQGWRPCPECVRRLECP